jgi:tetratricopeptide (TPR) repeat protein
LRRALELDPKNYPATYDLGRLLVRARRYNEALALLKRGAELDKEDPGVHYQLFLIYSRLKQKSDGDSELAIFKRLEEARKLAEGSMGGSATKEVTPPPDPVQPPAPGVTRDRP